MIDAGASELEIIERYSEKNFLRGAKQSFLILLKSESEIKRSGIPMIALEMTVIKMCMAPRLVDLSNLLNKIDSLASGNKAAGPVGFNQVLPRKA